MINLIHIATSITWAHFHYSFIANFKVLSICISIGYSWTSIAQDNSYNSFIANSKTLSIYISISYSWTSSDTIAESRDEYKSLCTGTSLYDSTPL